MKVERTEEFTEQINNLKMYKQLNENCPDTHSIILKQVEEKARMELTISNTFLNTQNNESDGGTAE